MTVARRMGGMFTRNYTTERFFPLEVVILSVKSVKWDMKSGKCEIGNRENVAEQY